MAIPTSRDPVRTSAALAGLLEHATELRDVEVELLPAPAGTGFSSDTVPFDAMATDAGARRRYELIAVVHPTGYSLYRDHDLESQWRVIDALHRHTTVPVPRVLAHDAVEGTWLAAPCFVMERVAGAAAADSPPYTVRGWLKDATTTEQRAVYERGLEVLAEIHRTDWGLIGLGFLTASTRNPVGVAAEIEHDEQFLAWILGERGVPLLDEATAWLRVNVPAGEELVLSWGDARLGNMLFRDFVPVAVLDWEMVTLADRAADVGWWLVFNRIHTEGIGRPGLPGIPDDDEAVDHYERVAGAPVGDLRFYEVRAALRSALLLIRYTDYLVADGTIGVDAARTPATPALVVLDRLLHG